MNRFFKFISGVNVMSPDCPETVMPGERPSQNQRDQFALALAFGERVSVWAKQNGVPIRTCYDWANTQEHKVMVREIRRRALDRAVGLLARNCTKAADQLALLATEAKSPSIRAQAARAMSRETLKSRKYVDLEERLVEIERRLDERDAKVT